MAEPSTVVESEQNPLDRQLKQAKVWTREIEASQKRMEKFNIKGKQVVKRYTDERETADHHDISYYHSFRLNLFHANITTLTSMLDGSVPTVEVSREWADSEDDKARVAAIMLQRMLQQNIESSGRDFKTVLRASLQDRLVPGFGQARVRYELQMDTPKPDEPPVHYEDAPIDYVHWQDFLWSFGRTWADIWWVAFRSYLTKPEVAARFGKEMADKLQYDRMGPEGADEKEASDQVLRDSQDKAQIWEIWSKRDGKVFWWSKGVETVLEEKADPLGLKGFFPCPQPMLANCATNLVMPTADFVIAQDLYNEVDKLQSRIAMITSAVRVVGVYDASVTELARMLKEGIENDMVPVESWAVFGEKGGLAGAIDWFPVKDIVEALLTLTQMRDQTIQLLYEVTGMSDILRGKSEQYAGVGQEQIKEKYASIRVQAIQDEFARFASDLQTLKAEVISNHFDPPSIIYQSNAKFLQPADQELIPPAVELIKSPSIMWRVNIRPESISMVDYAQLKAERTEYLMAIATFLQSAQAVTKEMPEATPMLLQMMKWGLAGFRGAKDIEGVVDTAIDQATKAVQSGEMGKKDDGNEKEKMQQELEQMKHGNAMQLEQLKQQGKQGEMQAKMMSDMKTMQADFMADMKKIQADNQADLSVIQAKLQADTSVEEAQSAYAILEEDTRHANDMETLAAEHAVELREAQRAHEQSLSEIAAQPKQESSDE